MKRGRPPVDATKRSTGVCVKLAAADYDAIDRLAKDERATVPAVIRRGVKQVLATIRRAP
jgi:hypothetical protein